MHVCDYIHIYNYKLYNLWPRNCTDEIYLGDITDKIYVQGFLETSGPGQNLQTIWKREGKGKEKGRRKGREGEKGKKGKGNTDC